MDVGCKESLALNARCRARKAAVLFPQDGGNLPKLRTVPGRLVGVVGGDWLGFGGGCAVTAGRTSTGLGAPWGACAEAESSAKGP